VNPKAVNVSYRAAGRYDLGAKELLPVALHFNKAANYRLPSAAYFALDVLDIFPATAGFY
jgi:hypothetical protein